MCVLCRPICRPYSIRSRHARVAPCKLRSNDGVAGVTAEFLPHLPLSHAECPARHGNRPAQPGGFPDDNLRLVSVKEGRRKHVGIVEILDERVGNALLAGRTASSPVAAVLSDQYNLP